MKKILKNGTDNSKRFRSNRRTNIGRQSKHLVFPRRLDLGRNHVWGCAVHHSSPIEDVRPEESFQSPVMCGMRWICLAADSPWPAVLWLLWRLCAAMCSYGLAMAGRFFSHDLSWPVGSIGSLGLMWWLQLTSSPTCLLFSMFTPHFHTTGLPAGFGAPHSFFCIANGISFGTSGLNANALYGLVSFHFMLDLRNILKWTKRHQSEMVVNLNFISTDRIWLWYDGITFGTCPDLNVGRCVVVRGLLAQLALSLKHLSCRSMWVSCS